MSEGVLDLRGNESLLKVGLVSLLAVILVTFAVAYLLRGGL